MDDFEDNEFPFEKVDPPLPPPIDLPADRELEEIKIKTSRGYENITLAIPKNKEHMWYKIKHGIRSETTARQELKTFLYRLWKNY